MEGFLNKNDKGQGVWAYLPCLLPPLALRNRGGGGARRRRPWAGGLGSGAALGEGKEGGRRECSIPCRGLARGGPWWPSHDGRRQRAAVALGRRLRGMVAVMEVGESTGELRGVDYPAHLGQG